ncbi:MAG: GNAT family N-acetyltransferase [Nocardioides sp.]
MVSRLVLRDGTPAWVWPLLPTDREALVAEFDRLSPESRRSRFLRPVVHLSDAMLQHLVDDVDGVDHVALVLMAEVGDDLVPAGIARCVRYPEQPEAADVAVTVKDLWHGHGVATALLEELMQQRPAGITHLLTEVAADNPASLAMLRRLGPTKVLDTGMGILDVEVDLLSSGRFLTAEEADDRLHAVLADPERRTLRVRDRVCPWLKPDAAEERGSVEGAVEEPAGPTTE